MPDVAGTPADARLHAARDEFAEGVRAIVADIPPGRVMTYGGIAAVLGSRASRRVGMIMRLDSDGLPWWRVVRAGGLPPTGHADAALERYRAEGTPIAARATDDPPYRILPAAIWQPERPAPAQGHAWGPDDDWVPEPD